MMLLRTAACLMLVGMMSSWEPVEARASSKQRAFRDTVTAYARNRVGHHCSTQLQDQQAHVELDLACARKNTDQATCEALNSKGQKECTFRESNGNNICQAAGKPKGLAKLGLSACEACVAHKEVVDTFWHKCTFCMSEHGGAPKCTSHPDRDCPKGRGKYTWQTVAYVANAASLEPGHRFGCEAVASVTNVAETTGASRLTPEAASANIAAFNQRLNAFALQPAQKGAPSKCRYMVAWFENPNVGKKLKTAILVAKVLVSGALLVAASVATGGAALAVVGAVAVTVAVAKGAKATIEAVANFQSIPPETQGMARLACQAQFGIKYVLAIASAAVSVIVPLGEGIEAGYSTIEAIEVGGQMISNMSPLIDAADVVGGVQSVGNIAAEKGTNLLTESANNKLMKIDCGNATKVDDAVPILDPSQTGPLQTEFDMALGIQKKKGKCLDFVLAQRGLGIGLCDTECVAARSRICAKEVEMKSQVELLCQGEVRAMTDKKGKSDAQLMTRCRNEIIKGHKLNSVLCQRSGAGFSKNSTATAELPAWPYNCANGHERSTLAGYKTENGNSYCNDGYLACDADWEREALVNAPSNTAFERRAIRAEARLKSQVKVGQAMATHAAQHRRA